MTRFTPCRSPRDECGAGAVLALSMGLILLSALAVVVGWSAVSVARHRLAAAADLVALSAAQSLRAGPDPCATARRIAAVHHVELAACELDGDAVTVRVTTSVNLGALGGPSVTTSARAGPA